MKDSFCANKSTNVKTQLMHGSWTVVTFGICGQYSRRTSDNDERLLLLLLLLLRVTCVQPAHLSY